MGERKVLNKYIPPDFDPSKIPRGTRKGGKRNEMKVRMMLPMSICCNTCGNYIMKGTKFNSRKEDALGEDYLGIQIFRFFFRCNRCSAEITMKTDPQNSDYTVERGASRNYEPWRDKATQEDEAEREREEEEEGNAMAALENRTKESKREMDIMAALDEMRSLNSRNAKVTLDSALGAISRSVESERKRAEEAEEAQAKAVFAEAQKAAEGFVRRLDSSDSDSDGGKGGAKRRKVGDGDDDPLGKGGPAPSLPKVKKPAFLTVAKAKPRLVVQPKAVAAPVETKKEDSDSGGGGLGLLGAYGSGSDSQ